MFFISRPTFFFNLKEMDFEEHPLHLHNYFEIIHLLQGEIIMQFASKHYDLHAGEFLFVPPHIPHAYRSASDKTNPHMRIISCSVDIFPLLKKNLLEKIPLSPVIHKEKIHPDLLYAEQRLTELDSSQDNIGLISALVSLALCRIFPVIELSTLKDVHEGDLTSRLISYIANHYQEDLSLDRLAREFGVSKYKLSRTFSSELGTNFSSCVNSLRISYAEYLLLSTNFSITQIAYDCGFNNQQTFNRVFREQDNCTPKEYRYQHANVEAHPAMSLSFPHSNI